MGQLSDGGSQHCSITVFPAPAPVPTDPPPSDWVSHKWGFPFEAAAECGSPLGEVR